MAQTALLTLDAVDAAMARSWLKGGHKIFSEVFQRLRSMAGLVKTKSPRKSDDAKANRKKLADRLALLGASMK